MLPFLIPRLYRPLMLEAWGITNTDLGTAFGAYGFSAMISYLLGGPFADKYAPRKLMAISLKATAIAGLLLMLAPTRFTLIAIYFFFGISTIFLMWGALIKVTHLSGGEDHRATAMGILDSGRGLAAAVMSSVLVLVVGYFFTEAELQVKSAEAIQIIYAIVVSFTFIVALFIWAALKNFEAGGKIEPWSIDKAKLLLKDIKIWLLGIIVLSAYCGYKSVDNYSIYLVDVLGFSNEESSQFTSLIFWLRPFSALIAGFLVDWIHLKNKLGRFYALTLLLGGSAFSQFFLGLEMSTMTWLILTVVLLSSSFAYALRAIYFAVLGDLNIKDHLVGTAVGIVSFVGYLPDMFYGIVTGHLIDSNPGIIGYSYSYNFTGILLLFGTLASIVLIAKSRS